MSALPVDYVSLGENPAFALNPATIAARLAGALLGLGSTGYAVGHLFNYGRRGASRGTTPQSSQPFYPQEGVDGVVLRPGEPGMGVLVPTSAVTGPSAIFVYAGLAALPADMTVGATSEDGWVYGAKLQPYGKVIRGRTREEMVVPTGNKLDIIKGRLLTWSSVNFADKLRACDHLCQADKFFGFDAKRPNQSTVRRGVATVVKKDGSSSKAYYYYQELKASANSPMGGTGGETPVARKNKYDVHIYFNAFTRDAAMDVRAKMKVQFPWLRFFDPKDQPIGPHPSPMWECDFLNSDSPDQDLGDVVAWLMTNRQGLSILVHPQTGESVKDHTEHAMWLGKPLQLQLAFLATPTKV
eukprot:gb/GEZN01008568.1/.p1 GENE.gb/GEZN01008568.1/~~gb/GEZN01008568.1/.p1  ORF type:complete len:355 (-),score=51.68 gb/GEZN01008568.1/:322-1386(-)